MECYSIHYRTNSEVTDFYISILEKAFFKATGVLPKTIYTEEISRGKKDDWYIVSSMFEVLQLRINRRKNIIFWIQGISPEESFLRNKSWIRFWILSKIEKVALSWSKYVIVVSDAMRDHLNKKYRITLDLHNSFSMPCFNEKINSSAFKLLNEKTINFTYVGSMAPYQNVGRILDKYAIIEEKYGKSVFLNIYTKEIDEAKRLVSERKINNVNVEYIEKEKLSVAIMKSHFGFILRDDILVNNVSTPTKICSYLANGVIPIYSSSIKDFSKIGSSMKYVIEERNIESHISELMVDYNKKGRLLDEYESIFSDYYSEDKYIGKISQLFSTIHN